MIRHLIDSALDLTVICNFDRGGFERHQRQYKPLDGEKIRGQTFIVTGGSSGIGLATVKELLSLGGKVVSLSRDAQSGMSEIPSSLRPMYQCMSLDLSDWEQIRELARRLPLAAGIVLNAGGMPGELTRNPSGREFQWASQVDGHFLLIKILIDTGKLKSGARVVWVSSGGMHLKKLDLSDLNFEYTHYDKVQAYANAKRAQVILAQDLAKQYPHIFWSSMHPGWVDTLAVRAALPSFYKMMGKSLRQPWQGADTICYLLAAKENLLNGRFWFDRKVVNPYIIPWTREGREVREQLWKIIESDISHDGPGRI